MKVQKEHRLPPGDFPNVDHFRDVLSGYNFDKLEKLKSKMIQAVDTMLGYDIPNLLKKFRNPYDWGSFEPWEDFYKCCWRRISKICRKKNKTIHVEMLLGVTFLRLLGVICKVGFCYAKGLGRGWVNTYPFYDIVAWCYIFLYISCKQKKTSWKIFHLAEVESIYHKCLP